MRTEIIIIIIVKQQYSSPEMGPGSLAFIGWELKYYYDHDRALCVDSAVSFSTRVTMGVYGVPLLCSQAVVSAAPLKLGDWRA